MLLVVAWGVAGATPARRVAPHGSAAPSALHQAVIVDAAVSNVDYQTDSAAFQNIVVVQGATRVTAERARAAHLDFKSSQWTFEGNVVMTLEPRGTLRSDQAVVQIRDDRVAQATATGHPAQFEQQRADSRAPLQGHADRIVFDARQDTVSLSGDAWLSNGRNEITGPVLVYSLRDETLTAVSPGRRLGVHITVVQPTPPGPR
ncbi:MAG: lipopolysaccharide transport periplasmic protein LptA [Steroidobacteraceae bacterium]